MKFKPTRRIVKSSSRGVLNKPSDLMKKNMQVTTNTCRRECTSCGHGKETVWIPLTREAKCSKCGSGRVVDWSNNV